jgi:hypothetical protein
VGDPVSGTRCGRGPFVGFFLENYDHDRISACLRRDVLAWQKAMVEQRLARYRQLYSRVGFVYQHRPLGEEELRFVLTHKWAELGLSFSPDDYTDAEALAAIARFTGGNFRLVLRLFRQIERILRI